MAGSLLGLINDILDLAKIEAGQMTMALEDYAVASLVQTVMAAAEPLAAAKSLKLAADVQEGMPMGRGDGRRLSQVLLNLVGNAVKFTDTGEVRIEAAATNGRFKLKVIDTGPGIAAADQVKIFEEFSQVDDSSTRKKGGTGLGLAISKRIVEMHGGRIGLVSEVGRGSTFEVSVPMRVDIPGEAAE
jgi:signal transduction histidine kinase